MDSDYSSDEEYGLAELDQMIQDEFLDSSDLNEEVDMTMLMSMQEEMDRQVEHILDFKGSIKGRRVINQDRGVETHDHYFKLKRDSCGQLSFSGKQKCTAALRMLALGTATDVVGEMVRMGESTCLKITVKCSRTVVEVFGPEYLREPNAHNTEKLLAIGEEAARKDVERTFGVLQARWGIARSAAMTWESETLWRLMTCCVVLHNMIVEVESDDVGQTHDFEAPGEQVEILEDRDAAQLMNFLHMQQSLLDQQVHTQLFIDLVEHMWTRNGNQGDSA
ncbi:uncharacterized protein [Aegilops tauschii subsp. strangulata]|uniref:uncharacterized protein n=1 Tax=Aegilops tauschii subsp. strangulata TaxID=200361 RepID=UPI003CC8B382